MYKPREGIRAAAGGDINSVDSYVEANHGITDPDAASETDSSDSEAKQDNTKVVIDTNFFQRIFEYMDENGVNKVVIDF